MWERSKYLRAKQSDTETPFDAFHLLRAGGDTEKMLVLRVAASSGHRVMSLYNISPRRRVFASPRLEKKPEEYHAEL